MIMEKNTCNHTKINNLEQYDKLLNEYIRKHHLNIEMVDISNNDTIHYNFIEIEDTVSNENSKET